MAAVVVSQGMESCTAKGINWCTTVVQWRPALRWRHRHASCVAVVDVPHMILWRLRRNGEEEEKYGGEEVEETENKKKMKEQNEEGRRIFVKINLRHKLPILSLYRYT